MAPTLWAASVFCAGAPLAFIVLVLHAAEHDALARAVVTFYAVASALFAPAVVWITRCGAKPAPPSA